jgi:hypothetical protein
MRRVVGELLVQDDVKARESRDRVWAQYAADGYDSECNSEKRGFSWPTEDTFFLRVRTGNKKSVEGGYDVSE